jgi:Tfp pilus assembly protein PilF
MEQGFLEYGLLKGVGNTGARTQESAAELMASKCDFRKRRALEVCAEAQELHLKGMTAKAIPVYAKSIRILPTAEAHAFLGWAYSAHHRYDLAIQECLQAIEIDPDYGNPYNDLGSYYVSQGKLEESILWFERAKHATRYESRHFPYLNLGRVYAAKGMKREAIREFQRALQIEPGEESCLSALRELRASLFEVV